MGYQGLTAAPNNQKRRQNCKTGGYLGLCACLPTGQLDTDERTKDDAGAIQNLVVLHSAGSLLRQVRACGLSIGLKRRSDGRLGPQATSTSLRTDAQQNWCNGRYAWDRDGRGSPAWSVGRCPDRPGSTHRMPEHVGPDAAELRLLTGEPDNVIHGLAGELCLAFRDKSECEMLKKIAPAGYDHYARHRPPWFGLKDF